MFLNRFAVLIILMKWRSWLIFMAFHSFWLRGHHFQPESDGPGAKSARTTKLPAKRGSRPQRLNSKKCIYCIYCR